MSTTGYVQAKPLEQVAPHELTPEQQRILELRANAKSLAGSIEYNQAEADARHKRGEHHLAVGFDMIAEMNIESLESVVKQLKDLGAPLDG